MREKRYKPRKKGAKRLKKSCVERHEGKELVALELQSDTQGVPTHKASVSLAGGLKIVVTRPSPL